ncbi:hypothetical protein BAUCODRAFT_345129 [Baudoinia panamericana UAMH 10762]|uniref:Uncharacterized protein n=1 Tax=Baudoinia panamericana (strain UAMH 10762) TaxID=717646 RepID=M2N6G8_BAUPA|nr:uncharacterized protein BAUCODRAFT_345129 [Baudoinia panamericana UAMH 10762]EMC99668.1 hypothetical protein BAUCODRAFT_345129 [Baudoinia panamericana UAMH 10762]
MAAQNVPESATQCYASQTNKRRRRTQVHPNRSIKDGTLALCSVVRAHVNGAASGDPADCSAEGCTTLASSLSHFHSILLGQWVQRARFVCLYLRAAFPRVRYLTSLNCA